MKENKQPENESEKTERQFVEKIDFYFENGLMVLTAHFLLKRGFCCQNDCLNCPYKIEDS
jgi:hypothetical protein